MVVVTKLRFNLELVDVWNRLSWGRLLGEKLYWSAVAKNCLGIFALHFFHEWNVQQLCLFAAPASEDGSLRNCDFGVVCILNIPPFLVKNCNIISATNLDMLSSESHLIAGMMCTSFASSCSS
jgi:hypothetical protein